MPRTRSSLNSWGTFTMDSLGAVKCASVGWVGGIPSSQVSGVLVSFYNAGLVCLQMNAEWIDLEDVRL